jgi:hypothetical protein
MDGGNQNVRYHYNRLSDFKHRDSSIAGEDAGINKQRTTCYRKDQAVEYPSGKKGPVFRKPTGFQKGNKRR